MTKQTEVEFIGDLSKNKFEELKKLLEKEGKLKKQKDRLSFMYFRDKIPKDLSEIKDEPVDLRFRVTNKQPEVIIKYGLFTASHARKEISIEMKPEEAEKYIDFLSCLGWNIGVIYAAKTYTYEYKGIEFSLVEIKDYGYNFEAEILTDESKAEESKKILTAELDKLGLKHFDKEGLNKQCNAINNKTDLQFDFSKQSFKEVRARFEEFF
ncbi:MAG: hypothetical protein KKE23_03815 [Nanoarchaeota archaeon]|nr:hypothetical protein [Nanoarchaeota archaeon]